MMRLYIKISRRQRRKTFVLLLFSCCLIIVSCTIMMIYNKNNSSLLQLRIRHKKQQHQRRILSMNLGYGDCKWTEPTSSTYGNNKHIDGTLFATYPAADTMIWQHHTEGLAGIQMSDESSGPELTKSGLVKTHYPHYEGIWSYGSNLNRVILLLRNPRWALPSYFIKLKLHELQGEEGTSNNTTTKAKTIDSVDNNDDTLNEKLWLKWRDYRLEEELNLWCQFIDYYMYNGAMYWYKVDFERIGQHPFQYRDDNEKPWPQDQHCISDLGGRDGCFPRAIVSYEHLEDMEKGPKELQKIATVLRNKRGLQKTLLEDKAIHCIYHETWLKSPLSSSPPLSLKALMNNDNTNVYKFTKTQLRMIATKLEYMVMKYSIGEWNNEPLVVNDLLQNLEEYLIEINIEIASMDDDDSNHDNNNTEYLLELEQWYNSIGKGNRYDKERVQKLDIWNSISYFYNEEEDDDNNQEEEEES